MEGSIKENPSKFGIRDKMFFGSMLIPETLFFFVFNWKSFSNNANSFDTFEKELLNKICISRNLMKSRLYYS